MNEIRVKRLQNQIRARVANVISQELNDPRLGLVTVTRVKLDKEIQLCKIFWTVLGDDKQRKRNAAALDHAKGYVRREIAQVMHTRSTPEVKFLYDESIDGVARIEQTLRDLEQERQDRGGDSPSETPDTEGSPD